MNKEIEQYKKLLFKYYNEFGDVFPSMELRGLEMKEQMKILEKCLKENKEYKFEYNEGVDY